MIDPDLDLDNSSLFGINSFRVSAQIAVLTKGSATFPIDSINEVAQCLNIDSSVCGPRARLSANNAKGAMTSVYGFWASKSIALIFLVFVFFCQFMRSMGRIEKNQNFKIVIESSVIKKSKF